MKRQRTRTAKRLPKKKNKFGKVTLSDFKICYKLAIAIKTAQYWHKNRFPDKWHRIDSYEINPVFMINAFSRGRRQLNGEK